MDQHIGPEKGHSSKAEDFVEVEVVNEAPNSFLESLLSPRTLHALMLSGGGLLVVGLVVWLWAQGVFENPKVAAVSLGAANLALLAAGVSAVRYSRYQIAGKAVTLLGCLVLPLNLWFYHAQGLVTLDQGGRLWIPALACCAIYAGVAWLLADAVYVYAIVGGVAMSGMLMLADGRIERFWEITSPSALLVVLGMICIHVERAFAVDAGPFSRAKFGRAFFQAGHVSLAAGLALLIGGHVSGWFYDAWFAELNWFAKPAVATQTNLKLIALMLSLGGVYSYLYSQLVVAQRGRYTASAVLSLVWSAMVVVDLLNIPLTMEVLALGASIAALLASVSSLFVRGEMDEVAETKPSPFDALFEPLRGSGLRLAGGFNALTLALCVALYLRARSSVGLFDYEFSFAFVVAVVLGGVASWMASLSRVAGQGRWNLQFVAVYALLALAAGLSLAGVALSPIVLAGEMLVPLGLAIYGATCRDQQRGNDFVHAAFLAALLLMMIGLGAAVGLVASISVAQPHAWLALLFAEGAVCFGIIAYRTRELTPAIIAGGNTCGFVWQAMASLELTQYEFLYASMAIGVMGLIVARLFQTDAQEEPASLGAKIAMWAGRVCISYTAVGTLLLGLARLLTGEMNWPTAWLIAAQAAATGAAALLSRQPAWRRHFAVLGSVQVVLLLFSIGSLSALNFIQRLELLATGSGLLLWSAGMLGWRREGESRDLVVSWNLALGSLLSATPLVIGLLCHRLGLGWNELGWVMLHELGVLCIGLLLLGVGVLCRIRWSTLVGSTTLAVYVLSLVLLVRLPEQLQSTAVYMMVGGGTFFVLAVLLSIYRDRLLTLSRRAREGEGVFQVLTWR